jgi:hypothetical protein
MIYPDRLGRWFVHIHQLGLLTEEKELLAAGALIEEEKVVLGSRMLDEVERMVLSFVVLARSWCSLDLFS